MVDYSKRLVEIDEILNYLPEEYYLKIPNEIINEIKEKKDKSYSWKYDENKKLQEQDLSRDTIKLLSYINTKYLLDNKQKEFVKKLYRHNSVMNEKMKSIKYNKDVFDQDKVPYIAVETAENVNMYITIKKEDSFWKKIINKIKNWFNYNK